MTPFLSTRKTGLVFSSGNKANSRIFFSVFFRSRISRTIPAAHHRPSILIELMEISTGINLPLFVFASTSRRFSRIGPLPVLEKFFIPLPARSRSLWCMAMMLWTFWPMTSVLLYPNNLSADWLQYSINPSELIRMIASWLALEMMSNFFLLSS